jgi:hypothetical protein
MAVTTNAFRADFVRRKFDVLIRELAVQGRAGEYECRAAQLLPIYYNDMRLQWHGHAPIT